MQNITAIWLQSIDALKQVPLNQLEWYIANSQIYSLEAEEILFKPNTPIVATYIVYSGQITMYDLQNGEAREFALAGPGAINGYLPFSRGKINFGYGRAIEKTLLLSFPVEKINQMICTCLELTEALVHVMTSRVRDFTTLQQQDEKMMALGKLSAGLAHEINNTISAILRDAKSINNLVKESQNCFWNLTSLTLEAETTDGIKLFIGEVAMGSMPSALSLKERNLLEDEWTKWLIGRHIGPAVSIAEIFAEFRISAASLFGVVDNLPVENLEDVLIVISKCLQTERMLNDIVRASQSILELVSSVKIYTHMDQGRQKKYTDINDGISNTLTMLRHKINSSQVHIIQEFDPFLPQVNARAGELNQVWANLIDNALDAIVKIRPGIIKIITQSVANAVEISFMDNGPGIAPAIAEKIFEPFFTTKEIKKGSGLGLDVVRRVIRQHGGSISLDSAPGNTLFKITLPVNG